MTDVKDEEHAARRRERILHFRQQLTHSEAPYRWGAAEALGRLGADEALEDLIPLLADPDWRVRLKTAWALGRLGDADIQPLLMRLMRDESDAVQEMAKEAVQEINRRRLRK